MADTTDKALDALQERLIEHGTGRYRMRDVGIAALNARGKISSLRRERDALRAQLATARADTLREAARYVENYLKFPHDTEESEGVGTWVLKRAAKGVMSLTGVDPEPTPSAPSPKAATPEDAVDILADLDKAAGEGEILAKAAAQLIRQLLSTPGPEAPFITSAHREGHLVRSLTKGPAKLSFETPSAPSPEAVARAAETIYDAHIDRCEDQGFFSPTILALVHEYENDPDQPFKQSKAQFFAFALQSLADPATLAAIVAKAGDGE